MNERVFIEYAVDDKCTYNQICYVHLFLPEKNEIIVWNYGYGDFPCLEFD